MATTVATEPPLFVIVRAYARTFGAVVDTASSAADFLGSMKPNEITLQVETCEETGGYIARWDDPSGGGITTQGETLAELQSMVADAVSSYFETGEAPASVRLHFVKDPVIAVA